MAWDQTKIGNDFEIHFEKPSFFYDVYVKRLFFFLNL